MLAEFYASKAHHSLILEDRIKYFSLSKFYYPFEYSFRIVVASEMARLAVNNNSVHFAKLALPYLNEVLKTDLYSPEVLAPAVIINYSLGNVKEAKYYHSIFKQTAKRSKFLDFMKDY